MALHLGCCFGDEGLEQDGGEGTGFAHVVKNGVELIALGFIFFKLPRLGAFSEGVDVGDEANEDFERATEVDSSHFFWIRG